jgi:hypothetical protein
MTNFLDRELLVIRKLLNQGFLLVKLKSSLRKFYGRHHDLVDCYHKTWNEDNIPLRNICVKNDHGYIPFVVITMQPFPHSWHHRVCNHRSTTGVTSGSGTSSFRSIAAIPLILKERIPQIQIDLLHTLTYSSKLAVRGG